MEYIRSEVNSIGALNAELEKIETALDDKLGTESTGPRIMHADLDMNANQILNLGTPTAPTDPVRLQDIPDLVNQAGGALYVGEAAPATPFQGLRWYNPTLPATFVYYVDGDSGQWVEEAHEGVDGGLRIDLSETALPIKGSTLPFNFKEITSSSLPSPAVNAGSFLSLSDRGYKLAYSNGTNWLFVATDAIVS